MKPAEPAAFKSRVAAWATKLKCHPKEVAIIAMRKKWASCSTRGRVCFSRDVLKLPRPLQDYIIVHELLHLRHPDHHRVFKSLVRAHLPKPVFYTSRGQNWLGRRFYRERVG